MITLGELKIYPKLYAAAVENAHRVWAKTPHLVTDGLDLGAAFTWIATPQESQDSPRFWGAINDGDFEAAKAVHPELFEEEAKPQYDSIQIGCKKPKPALSYLRNDKEREEAREVSDRIFRKRYVP